MAMNYEGSPDLESHGINLVRESQAILSMARDKYVLSMLCDRCLLLLKQVAQLSYGRDRTCSAILRGWVTLRLNYRLKGYVSHQYLWTVR